MHRVTARLLVLFALLGSFVPIALAVATPRQHACCVRKSVHSCHGSQTAQPAPTVASSDCCSNHDCSRALIAARWAHPRPAIRALAENRLFARIAFSVSASLCAEAGESTSARAPPNSLFA
jgi:hypothetical protein